jgi:hypothetical protein
MVRPGAKSSNVAMALAMTVSCRVTRLVTPGPIFSFSVSRAVTASVT